MSEGQATQKTGSTRAARSPSTAAGARIPRKGKPVKAAAVPDLDRARMQLRHKRKPNAPRNFLGNEMRGPVAARVRAFPLKADGSGLKDLRHERGQVDTRSRTRRELEPGKAKQN